MTVTGNLVLESAAIYMVTINGANSSGALVSVTATIDTGAFVAWQSGQHGHCRHQYTILTATGGVTGIFADPDVFFGRYKGVLSYDADDVFMTVQNGALVPLLPARSAAERAQRRQRHRHRDPEWRDAAARIPEPVQLYAGAARTRWRSLRASRRPMPGRARSS